MTLEELKYNLIEIEDLITDINLDQLSEDESTLDDLGELDDLKKDISYLHGYIANLLSDIDNLL